MSEKAKRRVAIGAFVVALLIDGIAFVSTCDCPMPTKFSEVFVWREKICMQGEYPTRAADGSGGRSCVKNGEEPLPGMERYPPGQVPKYVGDKYDK